METWHPTTCTKEAAALASLGATVKIWSSLYQKTGDRRVRFDVSDTAGKWSVKKLRGLIRTGRLRDDPTHPLYIAMLACHHRELLLGLLKNGLRLRLEAVPGAPAVFRLVPSDTGLPGTAGHTALATTMDLALAAALLTSGFPLLAVAGAAGGHVFTFPSHPLPGGAPLDAATLIETWRTAPRSLDAALTFTIAVLALAALGQLHREVRKVIDTILIAKPRSTSHVVIRSDAAPAAWDKAKQFLAGQ